MENTNNSQNISNLLIGLNPPQMEAVIHTEGALLVLAGAGTGKTRVLTTRMAGIIMDRKAAANRIMAVTFTNKAAREMKNRIEQTLGQPADGMWLGTFHSLCSRLLRSHPEAAGLERNFTIVDMDDQTRLCKQILSARNIDDKKWPARQLVNMISRWKDNAWGVNDVPRKDADYFAGCGRALYGEYQKQLQFNNAVDFGDLLLKVLQMFKSDDALLAKYQDWFQYVLVDEYQDTNAVQYMLIRLLVMKRKNICVVGDDDQSIYAWRGAEVGNILRFEKDFPGAKVVKLEQNYRSTGNILNSAASLISNNNERHDKTLWTECPAGDPVEVHPVSDGWEESRMISDRVESEISNGIREYHDMAVLVRTAAQTRSVEERFNKVAIPYEIVGGLRFYDRKEIRDAIAYLRLVVSDNDSLAFERIINVPRRGVGDSSMGILKDCSQGRNLPLYLATKTLLSEGMAGRASNKLQAFVNIIEMLRKKISEKTPDRLMETILQEVGYLDMLDSDKNKEDAKSRKDNLKELLRAMQEHGDVEDFLEHVALVSDRASDESSVVKITTVHAAKGLEFDTVFIPGFEEGIFPHKRSLDEEGTKGLQEERRLAYVAITRAKRQLIISYAASRYMYGEAQFCQPSRFITEIPDKYLKLIASSSPSYSQGGGWGGKNQNNYQGNYRPSVNSQVDKYGKKSQPMWVSKATGNARKTAGNASNWNKSKTSDDGRVAPVQARSTDADYPIGGKVFHQKFGYGKIKRLEGSGDTQKLTIQFTKAGEKKLMTALANLENC